MTTTNPIPEPIDFTVAALRKAGYQIRVRHFRWMRLSPGFGEPATFMELLPTSEIRVRFPDLSSVESRGGETHVEIICPNGKQITGTSVCMLTDAFNYKEGVTWAIKDAFGIKREKTKFELALSNARAQARVTAQATVLDLTKSYELLSMSERKQVAKAYIRSFLSQVKQIK